MNKLLLSMFLLCCFQISAQELKAAANSDLKKKIEINASQVVDGDMTSVWKENLNDKIDLYISLQNAKKIKSFKIFWSENIETDLSLKYKVKGGWKKLEDKVHNEDELVTLFDFSHLGRTSRLFHLVIENEGEAKEISIREIKINDEANDIPFQQQQVKKPIPPKDTQKEDVKNSKKSKLKDEHIIKPVKTTNSIFI